MAAHEIHHHWRRGLRERQLHADMQEQRLAILRLAEGQSTHASRDGGCQAGFNKAEAPRAGGRSHSEAPFRRGLVPWRTQNACGRMRRDQAGQKWGDKGHPFPVDDQPPSIEVGRGRRCERCRTSALEDREPRVQSAEGRRIRYLAQLRIGRQRMEELLPHLPSHAHHHADRHHHGRTAQTPDETGRQASGRAQAAPEDIQIHEELRHGSKNVFLG